jgi:hypothetical protein
LQVIELAESWTGATQVGTARERHISPAAPGQRGISS